MARKPKRSDSGGFCFTHEGFSYQVHRPLIQHAHYDTILHATRTPAQGGRSRRVLLRQALRRSPGESYARTVEEVRLTHHLRHPKIAFVYGWVEHGQQPYIVQEYVPGCFLLTALDAAVMAGRGLSPEFAAYVAAEVADALAYAHHAEDEEGRPLRLIHRAVGPVRIRLGQEGRVKLTDFGSSYSDLRHRVLTEKGLLRGDPAYIAPEVLKRFLPAHPGEVEELDRRGGVDARADVFSLGLVLLEMLTACYPIDELEELWKDIPEPFPVHVRSEQPPILELRTLANRLLHFGPQEVQRATQSIAEPLQHIIRRAMQAEPACRYQSAAEMRDDLRAFIKASGQPFGAEQAQAELKSLLMEAADMRGLGAHTTVELGVLPGGDAA
jgi:eukaryotic-like serine/threonine-protein kinase